MSFGEELLLQAPVQFYGNAAEQMGYRIVGQGAPLLLIHGFPLHGLTYRKMISDLIEEHTCIVVDLVGAGESRWQATTDFSLAANAQRLQSLMRHLGYDCYSVLAHDSGGSVARHLAAAAPGEVARLALINTEIPHWRPPWIPCMQKLLRLPGRVTALQLLLNQPAFRRSAAGFGGCFWDKQRIEDQQFIQLFAEPLVREKRRAEGVCRFLAALDWDDIDSFEMLHRSIACPVLLIWGREDPTFPYEFARPMVAQFPRCVGLHPIQRAKLFPHEERPKEVLWHVRRFLRQSVEAAR